MDQPFRFNDLDDAIGALASSLATTAIESRVHDCAERISAADTLADRDSPAADVSAMDGYAIRLSDLQTNQDIPVAGECAAGSPPPRMPKRGAHYGFSRVPSFHQAAMRSSNVRTRTRMNHRFVYPMPRCKRWPALTFVRRGENAAVGGTVVSGGTRISAAVHATMANFGAIAVDVYSAVRVTVITTGDEVHSTLDTSPKPWQLRNSNQVAMTSLLFETSMDSTTTSHPLQR